MNATHERGVNRPSDLSLGAALFHGLVLASAVVLLGRTLALPSGVASGAVAAVLASLAATLAVHARLRIGPTLGLGLGVGLGLAGVGEILAGTELPARLLGVRSALAWVDALFIGGLVFGLVLALRALALRARVLLVVEAVLVVSAVAAPVAAHQQGMIARPLEIADWFWQRGLDPVLAFLGFGMVGLFLAAGTLARGQKPARTLLQLLAVVLLGLLCALPLQQISSDSLLAEPAGSRAGQGQGEGNGAPPGGERPATSEDQLDDQQQNGPRGQQRPAAVVVFHKDVRPLGGVFYFRHAAFSQFNGVRLIESTRADADQDVVWRFPATKRPVPEPPGEGEGRSLVATDVALLTEHRRLFALTDPVEVAPMANPSPARFKRAYRVVSSVVNAPIESLLGRAAGDAQWGPDVWAHYTELPADPRYYELAARIDSTLRDAFRGDPMARALAVKKHLEETTIYSFERRYTGEDPTAEFLFGEGERKGFCTHISHAAAFILRAMGVPSRVGAGYGVMADNLRGGSALLIKTGDAHAWVEVYLGGIGWVPVEIVPERTEFEPPAFQEEDLQRLLGEMARGEGRESLVAPDESAWLARIEALLRALPWVALALVVLAYLIKAYRLACPGLAVEAVRPAYRAGLDRLAAVGFVRERGESRVRFAKRVAEVAPSFPILTDLLESSVLGRRTVGRAPGGLSAAGLSRALGRELSDHLPRWRRFFAALHPIPWWWSK